MNKTRTTHAMTLKNKGVIYEETYAGEERSLTECQIFNYNLFRL